MSKGTSRHSRAVDAAIPEEDRREFVQANALALVNRKDALIARHRKHIRELLLAKHQLRIELQRARERIAELEAEKEK